MSIHFLYHKLVEAVMNIHMFEVNNKFLIDFYFISTSPFFFGGSEKEKNNRTEQRETYKCLENRNALSIDKI